VRAYRDGLRAEHNLEYVMIWETANDERVCPVCGALHGKREDDWNGLRSPPAHPRCRCGVRLERIDAT
jgi:SPP1 gp7 family putative phage head morphogenesis protein